MNMIDTLKKTLGGEVNEAEMDILDTLKQDHEDVAEMLDRLVESDNAADRKNLLASIKAALVPHLRAEEKVVYDPSWLYAATSKGRTPKRVTSSTGSATSCLPHSAR